MRPEFKNEKDLTTDQPLVPVEPALVTVQAIPLPELTDEPEATQEPEYVRVTCEALNVREEPYKSSNPIAVAEQGSSLQKLGDAGDWTKVSTATGLEGYCMSNFLEKVEA